MAPPPSELVGAAGRRYVFRQLIQERPHFGRVWLAKCVNIHVVQLTQLMVPDLGKTNSS